MQATKLLRNLCAGEVANKNSFVEHNGIGTVLTVLRSAALLSDPDFGIIRLSLQVLANVSLAGAEHQQAIWLKLFTNEFFILASIRSLETSDPLCMILYTCCDGKPGLAIELCRDPGLPIVAGIIRTVASDVVDLLLSNDLTNVILSLLHDLEPPAIIRKTLKDSENGELNLGSTKLCPYKGFRRDLVAIIGNCAYRRKNVQDEIRQKSGILLLLQQRVTNDDNPYLREWGIWSLRNLLEGNAENQQIVADLQLQGSVDMPELARLGLKVEVDQNTHRAKLVISQEATQSLSSKLFLAILV
uniref:Ataxin-10 domain-containing protein n=1 Tax=Gossypium raimondii TaxID=29730 RepID=A0A0D2Q3J7_GOSRA|nr:hypothetical protein B456_002G109400 [Gossypium raimondii]